MKPTTPERLLRLPEVRDRTGLSRSQLYALAQSDEFPAPIKLSTRSSAWRESEIDEWIAERIAASRGGRNVA